MRRATKNLRALGRDPKRDRDQKDKQREIPQNRVTVKKGNIKKGNILFSNWTLAWICDGKKRIFNLKRTQVLYIIY